MRSGLTPGRSGLLPLGLPASGLTEGRSAGLVLLPGRLSPGRLPGRVTLIGLSLSSDLNPPLPEGFVPAEGLVPPDEGLVVTEGFVAGLSTVMLGLRSDPDTLLGSCHILPRNRDDIRCKDGSACLSAGTAIHG